MPVTTWGPEIKAVMVTVRDAAFAADPQEIPTKGEVYGYKEWPAAINVFPAILIGTLGGSQDYGIAAPRLAYHNVRIWVFIASGLSLKETQAMAWPFVKRVRDEFAINMKLSGTVNHFLPPPHPAVFYEVGIVTFAGKEHAAIIFNYDLKETEDFTVQA